MAPKSVTFRRHDHLVSVLFGDLLSHSYNITFSMFCILSFKDLQESLRQEKRLANALSITPCRICPRFNAPYNSRQAIYVQLRIAQCHVELDNLIVSCLTLTCLLLGLKSEGLRIEYLKFDQPSQLRNDFQRCLR